MDLLWRSVGRFVRWAGITSEEAAFQFGFYAAGLAGSALGVVCVAWAVNDALRVHAALADPPFLAAVRSPWLDYMRDLSVAIPGIVAFVVGSAWAILIAQVSEGRIYESAYRIVTSVLEERRVQYSLLALVVIPIGIVTILSLYPGHTLIGG